MTRASDSNTGVRNTTSVTFATGVLYSEQATCHRQADVLGLALQAVRLAQGKSLEEVARKLSDLEGCRVSSTVLNRIEAGHQGITILRFMAICEGMDVEPSKVVNYIEMIANY